MLDSVAVGRVGCALAAVLAISASASATVVIDFATRNDNVTPLENGRRLSSIAGDYERGLFSLSSTGGLGAAIFDSSDPGPNSSGADGDLLVNLGNLVIIQEASKPGITNNVFNVPDDENAGGEVRFDFTNPSHLHSIALVDIDNAAMTTVTLQDLLGRTRIYSVPNNWTKDIDEAGPLGYGILSLLTITDQPGESTGGPATAVEDAGFDQQRVVSMTVDFSGSGALTNLVFVPTPGALALAASGFALGTLRRRR